MYFNGIYKDMRKCNLLGFHLNGICLNPEKLSATTV